MLQTPFVEQLAENLTAPNRSRQRNYALCPPLQQQGYLWDGEDYMGQDIPFMQALLATEGLIALFSGHDHRNNW